MPETLAAAALRVATLDDVDAYVRGVLDGTIVAGALVRLAVERHARDLATGAARGLVFDRAAAESRLEFCAVLTHVKGEFAGAPFTPEPWQAFVLASVHGWRRADGRRRFTTVYVQVAKKNGKTFLGAGEGLYGLGMEAEPGAEVYSIATKEEQAKLSWSPAKAMVERSGELQAEFGTSTKSVFHAASASLWRPLGADSKKQDGMNPSKLLVDELHAHPNGDLYLNMKYSMAARRHPLAFIMTTAGAGRTSFCYSMRQTCEKVLRGVVDDDTLFAFVAEIDEGDDWRDERVWPKANPNLGVSVKLDFLREERDNALRNPRMENDFRRYHCDEWTEQAVRWIVMHEWDAGASIPVWDLQAQAEWLRAQREALRDRDCWVGLDLGRTSDLCAAAYLFPPRGDEPWIVLPRFWIPESKVDERSGEGDHVPYRVWAAAGFLEIHPGNVLDSDRFIDDLVDDARRFVFTEVAYDPGCGARAEATRLAGFGLPMIEYPQSWANVSPAAKELEKLYLRHALDHGANPVLRWNAANCAVAVGRNDNVRPEKDRSSDRIDGIPALINALGRAMVAGPGQSVYDREGGAL